MKAIKKVERLNTLLGDLKNTGNGIEASSVVSADGFMIASVLPHHAEKDRIALLSAALLSLGEQTAKELSLGELSRVYVQGESGYVVVVASGKNAVLSTVARKDTELAIAFQTTKEMAEKAAKLV